MSIATPTKPISTNLPWQVPVDQHQHDTSGPCPLLAQMPQPLREAAEQAPHLFRYLHAIPIDQLGFPEYHAELSFDLARLRQVNLIYPVGDAGYAHVCTDSEDSYSDYVSIEPCFGVDLNILMSKIEGGLVASIERLAGAESDEALAEALSAAAERGFPPSGSQQRQKGRKNETPSVVVPKDELEAVKYLIIRDKVRLGALEPLLKDPNLDTISCSGVGRLFVQHRIFGHLKTGLAFDSIGQLDEFVLRLAEKAKKPVTGRQPVADAVLSDGARINIVFGSEISRRGTNFTISKSPPTPMSVLDLVALGTLNYTMVAYLSLLVREGMNIFICGEGGSGKTALLNALSVFVAADAKIVSIEDTPELRVPHSNWIREVVREGPAGESTSDVTVFALLKAALRQRPNVIVMGEIRGEEGNIAFQAMQTGHEVLATMHASSVEKLIQRLTGSPINVPKAYVDNLNVAVITGRVRLPDGRYGRRILSMNEIVDYDSRSDSFSFVEVFRWDSSKDRFEFVPQSYLMERKIAFRRGLSPENKRAIYDELSRREALFEALHARTSGFYELYELLSRAYSEGLM
jgi:flagellar protein FlaI